MKRFRSDVFFLAMSFFFLLYILTLGFSLFSLLMYVIMAGRSGATASDDSINRLSIN